MKTYHKKVKHMVPWGYAKQSHRGLKDANSYLLFVLFQQEN